MRGSAIKTLVKGKLDEPAAAQKERRRKLLAAVAARERWRRREERKEPVVIPAPVAAIEAPVAAVPRILCSCGECRRCRVRESTRRWREKKPCYEAPSLFPEMTKMFPNFAEELASTMRYATRTRKRGGR